jgi:hypothetical protein
LGVWGVWVGAGGGWFRGGGGGWRRRGRKMKEVKVTADEGEDNQEVAEEA